MITYIANARLPSEKAHSAQIVKMCEAFVSQGRSVELLYPFRFQPAAFRGRDPLAFYGSRQSFPLHRLPSLDVVWLDLITPLRLRPYLKWSLIQATSFAASVWNYTRRYADDVSHCYYARDEYSLAVLLRARRAGQLFFEVHRFPGPRAARPLLAICQRLTGLVTVTRALKDRFVAAGLPANQILVAPDGVDLTDYRELPNREHARRSLGLPARPIIGYVGRFQTMEMEKGIDTLLRSLARLRHRRPLLVCVGGPLSVVGPYRRLMAELHLTETDVRFVDRQPFAAVPLWLRACDIVTIPFPWTEHLAYYASPLKLFECLAAGTPIVATDLPALREVLTDGRNALLVQPNDPPAFARAFEALLGQPSLARRLARQALRDVAQYTWAERARRILAFIDASGRQSPRG